MSIVKSIHSLIGRDPNELLDEKQSDLLLSKSINSEIRLNLFELRKDI